jgi:hypothetical protein
MTDTDELIVNIWRGRETGGLVEYRVPARSNQTVLDVVTEVQRRHEPALAYRFACRVGVNYRSISPPVATAPAPAMPSPWNCARS